MSRDLYPGFFLDVYPSDMSSILKKYTAFDILLEVLFVSQFVYIVDETEDVYGKEKEEKQGLCVLIIFP